MPYDFRLEAQRIIDAIEPTRGAMMTLVCALSEAYQAGLVAAQASPPTPEAHCDTCLHLTPFELTDDLFTCPVVNIRIHRESAPIFGCNQHEVKA